MSALKIEKIYGTDQIFEADHDFSFLPLKPMTPEEFVETDTSKIPTSTHSPFGPIEEGIPNKSPLYIKDGNESFIGAISDSSHALVSDREKNDPPKVAGRVKILETGETIVLNVTDESVKSGWFKITPYKQRAPRK